MKNQIILMMLAVIFSFMLSCKSKNVILAQNSHEKEYNSKQWKLVFKDEFKNNELDTSKWSYSPRFHPAWARFLTADKKYVHLNHGNLVLRMDDAIIAGDTIPYHSGGIQTSNKFSFKYGKVEVRAKFTQGKGSWPAIWMMPEQPNRYGAWPKSGEIDIMEHVNNELHIHQTIHSELETSSFGSSQVTRQIAYNVNDFNTYGIVWTKDKIDFFVNGKHSFTYNKQKGLDSRQWPFDQPFYIILNQSGGAGWPGAIRDSDLPFEMKVDYVRVYQD